MTATKPRSARTKRNAPRKRAPKKTALGTPTAWNAEEAKTPAALTNAGLLADIPDAKIRAAMAERFADYQALDICVPGYRRELWKKGLLE